MKDYITFLLSNIVTKPEGLSIEESVEGTIVNIKICADEKDMGIIIGKQGKTIRSIRALARAKAIKDNVKIYIETC